MRAPRLVPYSLALTLGAAACGKTGAVRPPPPAHAAAPAEAPAKAAPWMMPPPANVSAPPPGAERDPNGVAREILERGPGTVHPVLGKSYVDIRYAGWERNGKQFEGTAYHGEPNRYDLADLVEGLALELPRMVEGDKRIVWLPAALAYGKRTNFAGAPKGDMTFEVELVHVVPIPATPPDLTAPPKDAKTTKSGLTYLVLKKGTGKVHPTDETRANVIYTGWTPNGKIFQTSIVPSDVASVRVRKLPPGWREAMHAMVEGDKWRLWLPGKLAFGDLPPGQEPLPFGPPTGPVVYEVELVKILE